MTRKIVISIGALVALGLLAVAFYSVRARAVQPPLPDVASPEPSEFREASVASPPPIARNEKVAADTKNKKRTPTAELALKTGEVLNYTANVSKLDNVATLTLKVAGKGNFLGKNVWHLQAAAHTLKPLRIV